MLNLRELAKTLRGEVVGNQVMCAGPGHSPRDRSLSVKLSSTDPAGFTVYSHAGDDFRACRDHVKRALNLRDHRRPHARPPLAREDKGEDDRMRRMRDMARALFAETIDIRGTLGERYLASERGLPGIIDDALALTLRFHPSAPFRDSSGRTVEAPALICAVRDLRGVLIAAEQSGAREEIERNILADTELVSAVQRIRLTREGKKIERKSLGDMGSGVVLCTSIFEVLSDAAATIAEGVETALAMRALGFRGAMALCSASRFRTFDLPPCIRAVTISAENDGGASEAAWRTAGERWARSGVEVQVWAPPETDAAGAPLKDANDLLRSLAREGRAA